MSYDSSSLKAHFPLRETVKFESENATWFQRYLDLNFCISGNRFAFLLDATLHRSRSTEASQNIRNRACYPHFEAEENVERRQKIQ